MEAIRNKWIVKDKKIKKKEIDALIDDKKSSEPFTRLVKANYTKTLRGIRK